MDIFVDEIEVVFFFNLIVIGLLEICDVIMISILIISVVFVFDIVSN